MSSDKVIEEKKQGQALLTEQKEGNHKKLFIESYGCSMNLNDSEIVAAILSEQGYNTTHLLEEADLVLVNTCSIREKAEQTVRKRLEKYNAVKKINPTMKVGVLGCMAERLKAKFLEEEKIVDLVVGPDAYKDLPNLLAEVSAGRDAVNVILSKEVVQSQVFLLELPFSVALRSLQYLHLELARRQLLVFGLFLHDFSLPLLQGLVH